MIPNNAFTATPEVASFIAPYNLPYSPLQQIVLGGIALNDPSKGRMYKNWLGYYDGTDIKIKPVGGVDEFTYTAAGVITVSIAFDNNMNPVLGWQTASGSIIYYYNTLTATYATLDIPGTTSCRVGVDDPRDFNVTNSDVLFAYTLNGKLCWRQQRDRYATEYIAGDTTGRLIKMAPSLGNRLQFELI